MGRRRLRDDELRPASPRASERGRLAAAGHSVRVRQELRLQSPSAAAAVVNGRPANGTMEWKTPGGQTYKEWEAQQLSTAPAS
ncbi:DUF4357 domain-containing protein [Bradyrhizobium sp. WSM2254]|uniref:DUF4357 domain-containing protein n=1 Tax=Bradyrhizobium sp. WSM2254 TaxID=1188263 RepID=UPI003524ED53